LRSTRFTRKGRTKTRMKIATSPRSTAEKAEASSEFVVIAV
jgi:hypothetical protein